MVASEETRKKFNSVNFAPLFKKYQPKYNELSENMRAFFNKDPEKDRNILSFLYLYVTQSLFRSQTLSSLLDMTRKK